MGGMRRASGFVVVVASFGAIYFGISRFGAHDLTASIVWMLVGLAGLRGAMSLLRPFVAE